MLPILFRSCQEHSKIKKRLRDASQIVSKVTHKNKILDIILTNLHRLYQIPIIVPPVMPDDPTRGVASDHSIPLALPVTSAHHTTREYKTTTVRPLPESGIQEFSAWLSNFNWDTVFGSQSPTEQVEHFQKTYPAKSLIKTN